MSDSKNTALKKGVAVILATASLTALAVSTANNFANAETGDGTSTAPKANENANQAVTSKAVNFADATYGAVAHAFAGTNKAVDASPLTDGNASTAFKPGAANYSFDFNFGQPRTFTNASVTFRHGSTGTVLVSDDGKAWTPALNFKNPVQVWNLSEGAVSGHQYVKFLVDSTADAAADFSDVEVQNVTFNGTIQIPSDYDVVTTETKKDQTGAETTVKGDLRQNLFYTDKDSGYEGFGVSDDGKADLHVGESKDFYFKAKDGDTAGKFTVTSTNPDAVEVSAPTLVNDAKSPVNGYYKVTVTLKAPTGNADGNFGGTKVIVKSTLDKNSTEKVVLVRGYYYADGVDLLFGAGSAPDNGYVLPVKSDTALGPNATAFANVDGKKVTNGVLQRLYWASDNESVVKVEDGSKTMTTGNKAGKAAVTIHSNDVKEGVKAENAFSVKTVYSSAEKVEIVTPDTYDADKGVEIGKTVQLTAKVTPDRADQTVTWKSSDEKVATVDANGLVTATGEGTATIQAVSKTEGVISQVSIKAVAPAPTEVNVTAPEGTDLNAVKAGETIQLTAKVGPEGAHQDVVWRSSDEKVATVDANGLVTAVADGKVTITAVAKDTVKTANNEGIATTADTAGNTKPGKDEGTSTPEQKEVFGSVDITVVPAEDPEEFFAGLTATYKDADGKDTAVEGWDATKDGSYKLPEGTDLSTLALKDKDGKDVKALVTFTKDGKAVDEAKDADTAVYNVTVGKTTRTFTFTVSDAAVKTWKVTVKNNNGLDDSVIEVADGTVIKDYTDPVYSGHTLVGYYTTEDFKPGTEFDFKTTPITSDITVYVKWTEDGTENPGDNNKFTDEELAALKNVKAYYKVNGKDVAVNGFDGTKDGSYTIDGDVATLRVEGFPKEWQDAATIKYTATKDGKTTEVKEADADSATVVLTAPSGAKVTYAFTESTANNANNNADNKANAQQNTAANNGANGANNGNTPAKTGAAAGIIGIMAAAMIAAGAFFKKFSANK